MQEDTEALVAAMIAADDTSRIVEMLQKEDLSRYSQEQMDRLVETALAWEQAELFYLPVVALVSDRVRAMLHKDLSENTGVDEFITLLKDDRSVLYRDELIRSQIAYDDGVREFYAVAIELVSDSVRAELNRTLGKSTDRWSEDLVGILRGQVKPEDFDAVLDGLLETQDDDYILAMMRGAGDLLSDAQLLRLARALKR